MLTSTGSAASARGDISPRAIAPANHRNMIPPSTLVPRLTGDGNWLKAGLRLFGFKQDRIMLTLQARILWYVVKSGITIMRAKLATIFLMLTPIFLMPGVPASAD